MASDRIPDDVLREIGLGFPDPHDRGAAASQRLFSRTEDGYRLILSEVGIVFDLGHLRRQHGELWAQLRVESDLVGSRVLNGSRVISVADLNLSSLRSRQDRAKFLSERSQAPECDWPGLLEELILRVFEAEQHGEAAMHLRDVAPACVVHDYEIDGIYLPRAHPSLIYGAGGALKSYLGLWIAGSLVHRGIKVLYADWELTGADHKARLLQLFGLADLPDVLYARCDRPMIAEADRLKRIIRGEGIDYLVADSLSFAAHDAPESADTARAYWAVTRQLGIGSLHLGHISKSEEGNKTPFGSVFWLNGARSCWNIQRSAEAQERGHAKIALYHRKSNLGPLRPACAFAFEFGSERVSLRPTTFDDVPDLAAGVSLGYRIRAYLAGGSKTKKDITEEFADEPAESLRRTLAREIKAGRLIEFPSSSGTPRLGLPEKIRQ